MSARRVARKAEEFRPGVTTVPRRSHSRGQASKVPVAPALPSSKQAKGGPGHPRGGGSGHGGRRGPRRSAAAGGSQENPVCTWHRNALSSLWCGK